MSGFHQNWPDFTNGHARGNTMISSNFTKCLLSIALLAGLQACTLPHYQAADTQLLLSGTTLFGEEVRVPEAKLSEILAINDEMRAYVANSVGHIPYSGSRLRALLQSMIDDGLLNLEYDSTVSNSAIDTFYTREGNCLSFANLFVALAREAGLEATFQMVAIPPSYSSEDELVLLNNHINVVISGIQAGGNFVRRQVVDFNNPEFNGNYDTRRVSDNHVLALFHSNLAVKAMGAADYRKAFEHLKQGLAAEPALAELWVNLGVLYSRHEHYELAIQSYHQALSLRGSDRSALSNLANLYQHVGQQELADEYQSRIRMYRNRNPYYHFYLAQRAYAARDYELALTELKRAIRRKQDEHQFYYLEGMARLQLSNAEAAEISFTKARETAQNRELISAYETKLQSLQLTEQL